MLRYELVENTDEYVKYKYYPENQKTFGLVVVSKGNQTIIEQVIASNDELKWCFFKMFKRIKEFIGKIHFEEEGIIAWY